MIGERRPGRVPDEPTADPTGDRATDGAAVGPADPAADLTGGWDTDGDGRGDTAVTTDGVDLVLLTDLDDDGLADQVLRIGPDGTVRASAPPVPPDPPNPLDPLDPH